MKFAHLIPAAALFLTLGTVSSQAQIEHQVKRAKINVTMQQTPVFNVSGPKDKRYTPRDWLEIEVEIDCETVRKSGYIGQLDCAFSVGLKDVETNKTVILQDTISFLEINTNDRRAWLVAYISPPTLAKITGKKKPSLNDLYAVAVTISGPGLRKPVTESTGGPKEWWKSEKVKRSNGLILPREKTAFAPLWWDHYPRSKTEN